MAERNAQQRKAAHPKLSLDQLNKLKPKERILEELRIKPVTAEVTTTFSITIRWDYLYVTGEKQAQLTVVEVLLVAHESQICAVWASLDVSPDVKHQVQLHGSMWTSLPEDAVDVAKRQVYLGGLTDSCPGLVFRVRARHAVGWGEWSPQSEILQPLPTSRPKPVLGLREDEAYSVDVSWAEHARMPCFGQILCSEVFVRRLVSEPQGEDGNIIENLGDLTSAGFITSLEDIRVYSGRGATESTVGCAATQVGQRGQRPLLPGTLYSFRVETTMGLSRGDKRYNSRFVSKEATIKTQRGPPVPLSPCETQNLTSNGISLSWVPPLCDGGAQILRYRVFVESLGQRDADSLDNGHEPEEDEEVRCVFEGNTTSFDHDFTAADQGQRIGFHILAVNELGESKPGRTTWVRVPTAAEEAEEIAFAAAVASAADAREHGQMQEGLVVDTAAASDSGETHEILASPEGMVDLPEGWNEYWDPASEELFYYNVYTGENQWNKPTGLPSDARKSLVERHASETSQEREWRLFRKKRFRLLHHLHKTRKEQAAAANENPLAAFRLSIRRDHLVADSLVRLERFGIEALQSKLQVVFEGESGIDSGGLSKDWFLAFSNAMLQPDYCLFTRTERGEYELDPRGKLVPEAPRYIRIFGAVCGKALFDQQLVNAPLCTALLRRAVGSRPSLDDLREKDPVLARSLEWMLENDIQDIIEETFTVTSELFGAYQEVELIPGGAAIPVSNDNKIEYVDAIVDWHCGGSARGLLEAFMEGFRTLVPMELLRDFTPSEMRLLLNGKTEISVEDLRSGCVRYSGGYDVESEPVQLFWSVFADLTQVDRGRVLRFATGCDRVPLDGFSPLLPFTLTRSEFDKEALPTAHTCFHQLVLPPYETEHELRDKLLFACDHAIGFELT
ncbi:E3 ubiquitin-protein ligase RSP5 [Hondaea fermentalgiana]|uniref:HECT-type E3 ubiquitin transferase n=1 Tax=Hondaea fermentalgiana TaxID=2315210 RepID=A0A2R5GDP8_9STRA|nr:E3 ubiquitin-protein ligase RSP5 [Hondaea fermentalgiana]|eukprot:GBG29066.1 E3 ubiquitin-protein ligase RSP5 [Hondaea fermentalgiana]